MGVKTAQSASLIFQRKRIRVPTQAQYENSLQSLRIRREDMPRRTLLAAVSSISLATVAIPAVAADVAPQRLMNTAREPQNWLMIHHDYDNSRHSSLKKINRDT